MAIAQVAQVAGQFGLGGGTTGSINTTGATLLVAFLSWHSSFGGVITDSKGNTWTPLTAQVDFGMSGQIYYCSNPTVGSGHTFSTAAGFSGVNVVAFSGTRTASTPLDAQSGNHANASGNLQPGSITPSTGGCVLVTGFGSFNGAGPTIPTGYTSIATYATGTAEAGGAGYKIQTSASAENPTWNDSGSSQVATLACFLPPLPPIRNPAMLLDLI